MEYRRLDKRSTKEYAAIVLSAPIDVPGGWGVRLSDALTAELGHGPDVPLPVPASTSALRSQLVLRWVFPAAKPSEILSEAAALIRASEACPRVMAICDRVAQEAALKARLADLVKAAEWIAAHLGKVARERAMARVDYQRRLDQLDAELDEALAEESAVVRREALADGVVTTDGAPCDEDAVAVAAEYVYRFSLPHRGLVAVGKKITPEEALAAKPDL